MISSLRGTVNSVDDGCAEIEVSGVGYLVYLPVPVLAGFRAGQKVKVLTHLVVREDSMTLYGFEQAEQRRMFQMLLGVTGVGPKLAMALVSAFAPSGFRRAVVSGDVAGLTEVSGLGKRGAERIILELRARFESSLDGVAGPDSRLAEVRDALIGLGYTPAELRPVLEQVAPDADDVEAIVKSALRELAAVRT